MDSLYHDRHNSSKTSSEIGANCKPLSELENAHRLRPVAVLEFSAA